MVESSTRGQKRNTKKITSSVDEEQNANTRLTHMKLLKRLKEVFKKTNKKLVKIELGVIKCK
jgi:hypothetical protein